MQSALYDAAGQRRSPITIAGHQRGRSPKNKGRRYPADPLTVEGIITVMHAAGSGADGARLRALIVVLGPAAGDALTGSQLAAYYGQPDGCSSTPGRGL